MLGGMDEMGMNLGEVLGSMMPTKTKKRKVTTKEAMRIFIQEESQKLIDMEEVSAEAIDKAEQMGIVFLDEIDKIAVSDSKSGIDVSRGGVQRDILPLVEGATVNTKHGPCKPIMSFYRRRCLSCGKTLGSYARTSRTFSYSRGIGKLD